MKRLDARPLETMASVLQRGGGGNVQTLSTGGGPPAEDAMLGAVARALRAGVVPLAIALVTFAVFSPALWNGFVDWDDEITLYKNPNWRGLGAPQLKYFFTTRLMGHYIPVTWLTFGLDYELWGLNPSGYHLTSLVIYALSMAGLYLLALELLTKATTLGGAAPPRRRR